MRIAEYKQIDTEIVTEIIHHDEIIAEDGSGTIQDAWDEEVTKEIPVMGMVYRDMTEEEEAEMQKFAIEEATTFHPTTIEEKIEMLAEQITEVLPEGAMQNRSMDGTVTLPFKVGYRWEKKLVGNTIMWESVPDPNAIGTQENPIIYTDDVPLIDNAWYKKDGKLMVYMMGEFEEM